MSLYLERITAGKTLSEDQMIEAMTLIMAGKAPAQDLAVFLKAMAERGETIDEITGAARVLRRRARGIQAPPGAVDCCGTGGDKKGTYNISTAVALVAAACGVPMAKHGNRASSSKSGAADVLEALGVNLDAAPDTLEAALETLNFAFLMAPHHHQAMQHVRAVRQELKTRTLFNLLGPLANPAGTTKQLVGVFDRRWVRPLAAVLKNLGAQRAWVVHGADGLDEITTTDITHVAGLDEAGCIETFTVEPADFGLPVSHPDDLIGGDAQDNAEALQDMLGGTKNAYRDIVLANAAAVLMIAGKVQALKPGVEMAAHAIDSGGALDVLRQYIALTREEDA